MDATDASKVDYDLDNHASVNRDDAPTIRSVLTIDNRDVSSTTVEETKSIYEIYQSTHRTETTEIMNINSKSGYSNYSTTRTTLEAVFVNASFGMSPACLRRNHT